MQELVNTNSLHTFQDIARDIRLLCIKMAEHSGTGHIGSAFSMVEILTVLLFEADRINEQGESNCHFVLSKGHGALSYYAALATRGLIPRDLCFKYLDDGCEMQAFPSKSFHPSLDFSSGSLGHGVSVANGLALGNKLSKGSKKVYVVCSDGECQEGSVWEAAQFAGYHALKDMVVIVDANGLQAIDSIEDVMGKSKVKTCWQAFGWNVLTVDGHDMLALSTAIQEAECAEVPTLIWAETTKGKGVSFMENSIDWHYLSLDEEKLNIAKSELGE